MHRRRRGTSIAWRFRRHNWQLFSYAIAHPSLYILGAGASAPIIPMGVAAAIRRVVQKLGILDGCAEPPSLRKSRLLPPDLQFDIHAALTGEISQNELDAHTPLEVVETIFARHITVPNVGRPAQYAVFDCMPASVLFNFNNDNLGEAVHPRHLCLRPHGTVDVGMVHAPAVAAALRWLAIPASFVEQFDFHRPEPEPSDISGNWSYRRMIEMFDSLKMVVVIGYSFGEQRDTGEIDDTESFAVLTDLLRWRPKPVLVIGPDPEGVAARIEATARTGDVGLLACRWDVLSNFVLCDAFSRACKEVPRRGLQIVTSSYRRLEDALEERAQCA
jgi:hypothetical protein